MSELSISQENSMLIKRAPDNDFNMDAFIGEVRNEFSKYNS